MNFSSLLWILTLSSKILAQYSHSWVLHALVIVSVKDILNQIVKSLLEGEEELKCPLDRILKAGVFVCMGFICATQSLDVMLSAVWQLPASLSMLMLFKYLTKLVEIRQAGLSVDMDRIYLETLLHPLGIMKAA